MRRYIGTHEAALSPLMASTGGRTAWRLQTDLTKLLTTSEKIYSSLSKKLCVVPIYQNLTLYDDMCGTREDRIKVKYLRARKVKNRGTC